MNAEEEEFEALLECEHCDGVYRGRWKRMKHIIGHYMGAACVRHLQLLMSLKGCD